MCQSYWYIKDNEFSKSQQIYIIYKTEVHLSIILQESRSYSVSDKYPPAVSSRRRTISDSSPEKLSPRSHSAPSNSPQPRVTEDRPALRTETHTQEKEQNSSSENLKRSASLENGDEEEFKDAIDEKIPNFFSTMQSR